MSLLSPLLLTPLGEAMSDDWLDKVNWAQDGLVPAVAQEAGSGRVLTVAWMNREALGKTVQTRRGALLVALAHASCGARARSPATCRR